jgi:hypothetical protein
MVRPKGGRANPRYHHIRDASEAKYFAAIAQNERERRRKPVPRKFTRIEQAIYELDLIGDKIDAELICLRLRLKK